MLVIQLDTVRIDTGKTTYRMVNRASCNGLESVGEGDNIRLICALLIQSGATGQVEVRRGLIRVFSPCRIEVWASGKALLSDQPDYLVKEGSRDKQKD